MNNYDVIVIGGGHAGCEAAHASAKMGAKTLLVTANIKNIADTPCNPSIGGPAKGIVVREIDALGGLMGRVSDMSMLQIKMLNRSKGPAVQALRAQVDKMAYPKNMQELLFNTKNLTILCEEVKDFIIEDEIRGIVTNKNTYNAKKVILTAGTYLNSFIINGKNKTSSGPNGEKTFTEISQVLQNNGLELFRLKTGTPPRVDVNTVDFTGLDVASGDSEPLAFSFYAPKYITEQHDCYLIYTNQTTHDIINENMHLSGMLSGVIEGVGPRYCPSIEDKIRRFSDKERHQIFLEPESVELDTIYIQGFSTSFDTDIQDKLIKTLPGMVNAKVLQYGYAVEYDAIYPSQLNPTLETKKIPGLYTAGQINGTSGYEEAAGQGLIAGINAACSVLGKEPLLLDRTNSYIGLMIDDLITKGTDEPYRLLTSRSEYRLYLRHDNADLRLSEFGHNVGLLDEDDYLTFTTKRDDINKLTIELQEITVSPKTLNIEMANKLDTTPINHGVVAYDLLKRPNFDAANLIMLLELDVSLDIVKQVEINAKYEGYISKVLDQIKLQERYYHINIPSDIDFLSVDNLALEAREKLNKFRPLTLGHAMQINGINPSDIAVLELILKNK